MKKYYAQWICQLQKIIQKQIDAVCSNPAYQTLLYSWLGLQHLKPQQLHIEILSLNNEELKIALKPDAQKQSWLGRKLLDHRLYQPGAFPFNCLSWLFELPNNTQTQTLYTAIENMSRQCFCINLWPLSDLKNKTHTQHTATQYWVGPTLIQQQLKRHQPYFLAPCIQKAWPNLLCASAILTQFTQNTQPLVVTQTHWRPCYQYALSTSSKSDTVILIQHQFERSQLNIYYPQAPLSLCHKLVFTRLLHHLLQKARAELAQSQSVIDCQQHLQFWLSQVYCPQQTQGLIEHIQIKLTDTPDNQYFHFELRCHLNTSKRPIHIQLEHELRNPNA